jgi:hypothetical protein
MTDNLAVETVTPTLTATREELEPAEQDVLETAQRF